VGVKGKEVGPADNFGEEEEKWKVKVII